MKSLYIISFIYLTVVQATKVSFKLIAPDAKSQVHVKIDNVFTQLNAQDPDIPYYTGSAELDYGQNYTVGCHVCDFFFFFTEIILVCCRWCFRKL